MESQKFQSIFDCSAERDKKDFWSDCFFSICFFIDFVVVASLSYKSFIRNRSMINLANILLVTFLLLTLLNRLVCLLYTLIFDCNRDIDRDTVQMYLYFELPFSLINAASIVVFFEWT